MKNIMMMGMLFLGITYAVSITTEVVVDSKTKLEWQNQAINKIKQVNWLDAIDYCENLDLDGKSDWRLPDITELTSLVDYSVSEPAIVSTLQDRTTNAIYWSSTTYFKSTDKAYFVTFEHGFSSYELKSVDYFSVRCVRDN